MQPLDDHDLVRLDALRRLERPVGVVVDRFGDRVSALERPELLLHEREVVGTRIERGDADQCALPTVERVIVVEADGGDAGRGRRVAAPPSAVSPAAPLPASSASARPLPLSPPMPTKTGAVSLRALLTGMSFGSEGGTHHEWTIDAGRTAVQCMILIPTISLANGYQPRTEHHAPPAPDLHERDRAPELHTRG